MNLTSFENLTQAFFKYVPTQIGLSIVGAGIVLYKLTTSIKNREWYFPFLKSYIFIKWTLFLPQSSIIFNLCALGIKSCPMLRFIIKYIFDNSGAIERKEEKIANLDESLLRELAADDLEKEAKEAQKQLKKKTKAENKARQRIKAQKKEENRRTNGSVKTNEDEDDNLNVSSFANNNGKPKRK